MIYASAAHPFCHIIFFVASFKVLKERVTTFKDIQFKFFSQPDRLYIFCMHNLHAILVPRMADMGGH